MFGTVRCLEIFDENDRISIEELRKSAIFFNSLSFTLINSDPTSVSPAKNTNEETSMSIFVSF